MRFVASKKPVAGKHKKLGAFSVKVEVPQVESLQEFVSFAGGDDKALIFVNRAIETAAKNGGRAKARNLDEKNVTADQLAEGGEAYADILKVVREYTPQTSREPGISAAKSKEVVSTLSKAIADPNKKSWTREEIEAMLAAAK
jgi:hypothetical protein